MWEGARKEWMLLQKNNAKDLCGDKIVLFLLFTVITLFTYLFRFYFYWPLIDL